MIKQWHQLHHWFRSSAKENLRLLGLFTTEGAVGCGLVVDGITHRVHGELDAAEGNTNTVAYKITKQEDLKQQKSPKRTPSTCFPAANLGCNRGFFLKNKVTQSNYCRFFFDFGRFIYNRSNTVVLLKPEVRQKQKTNKDLQGSRNEGKKNKINKEMLKRTGSGRYLSAVYPSSHRLTSAYRCLRAYSYCNTRQRKVPHHHLRQWGFCHHETRRVSLWRLKCRGLSQERELCCGRTHDGAGKHQDHESSLGSRVQSITKNEKNPIDCTFFLIISVPWEQITDRAAILMLLFLNSVLLRFFNLTQSWGCDRGKKTGHL